jgi:DNA-binding NtrC family response regulator
MSSRILVMDDEKLIRWSLKQILSQDGYDVDDAATTDEALALAGSRPYGLIFGDLEICGDQGQAFYTKLLGGQTQIPVVILTALPKDQAEQALRGVRTFAIIEKPFAAAAIKAIARQALDAAGRDGNL